MDSRVVLLALLCAVPAFAGCFSPDGGRTDWAYSMSQLEAVNDLGRTGRGVTIAILDTGINVGHPSMDHLRDGDDSNGELKGFRDFLGTAQGASAAFDDDGHGTHVAGIITARGSSSLDKLGGIDLRGGAPDALILSARVCSRDMCDASTLPDAIQWAVAQGADIVSLSLGGEFGLRDALQERAIEQAVEAAIDSGVVVIASAGNKGPDNTDVESPANILEVIAVGAVDQDGHVADFSSRGDDAGTKCNNLPLPGVPTVIAGRCHPNQKPELVAPGVGILSAWVDDGFVRADGTSQATPFVTAAVALLLEGHGDLPNRAAVLHLKEVLVDSAKPLAGQVEPHDEAAGYGLLQAEAALRAYG
ncbi:MAG: serine protease AprX [Thermoplasmata archaeon]|jgi:serine protease AprX|nr:serine protease AprX [Thermoplasmata archaeon]MEA3165435.1 serine protease AprX [Thermoplasmata archaeon]